MNSRNASFNEQFTESRPSTAKSVAASIQGSMSSLKGLFKSKKIYPVIADVVYGTGEPEEHEPVKNPPSFVPEINHDVEEDGIENKQCCVRLLHRLKQAYKSHRDETVKKDTDLFIKETLKNLFIYIVYLIILLIITFGNATPNMYYFTTAMTDNILSNKFADNSGSFATIGSMSDFWKYLESPLLSSLYWNVWYNNDDNGTLTDKNLIYYDDKLIGVPRLRLLRVKPNSCQVSSLFKSQISGCYNEYSDADSDKTPFGPANDTAWVYSSNGSSISYTGELATYESGGFMQPLSRNITDTTAIIAYLKQMLWLDHNARVVFLDFTMYNPNVDLVCIVKLIFEFPSTGGALANYRIRSMKLVRYVTYFDFFIMFCEVVFMIFVFYYILVETFEVYKFGIRYFVQMWNLIDSLVILISFSCIGMNVYRCTLTNSLLSSLLTNNNQYADFDFAAYWQKMYNEAISINLFLAWIKIFKYISFNKTMSQLTDTLAASLPDVMGFLAMFIIVFFAYSQLAYLLLSSYIQDYRSYVASIFALFRIILCDFGFYDIYNANRVLGPLFFISFIFFVFFVLLTMFLAIMDDSYAEVKEGMEDVKESYHISTYLKNHIMSRLKKDKITKIHEVLQRCDIINVEELSFDAWRKELLQYGYADVEIQAIFMKYDQDGDRVLDYDERNKMLQDITDKKMDLMHLNEDNNSTTDSKEDNDVVTEELLNDVSQRIQTVEVGLVDIVKKIDQVLELLAEREHAKLDHQKNVRSTLDILQSSKQ